jgi:hypothetical protein
MAAVAKHARHSPSGRVTPKDIESKLRELKGEVSEGKDAAISLAISVGVVAVVGVALGAFLLGRRKGKKRSTVVEIRRI